MKDILCSKDKIITSYNLNHHKLPFVISIPHSGLKITKKMADQLIEGVVLANTDWYLPDLYEKLKDFGLTVIINNVSRYVIDPNRDLHASKGESYKTNLIYKKTTMGQLMYHDQLCNQEINQRIIDYYQPYHNLIQQALDEKLKYFDKVYLIDLHSFGRDEGAEIILGNRNGQTTRKSYFELVKGLLECQNFIVKENDPFLGGHITNYYGHQRKCEALQIELWYQCYIAKREFKNEELPVIEEKLFSETKEKMELFFKTLISKIGPNHRVFLEKHLDKKLTKKRIKIVDGRDYLEDIKRLIIEYTKSLNRDLSFQSLDEELKDLQSKYTGGHGMILAALIDDKIVGCIAYHRHDQRRCEMKRLFVLPKYRKLKIGYNLVDQIIKLARDDGYQEMVLDTIEPLKRAISLYHQFGFKEIDAYYNNPMDDVIYMRVEL